MLKLNQLQVNYIRIFILFLGLWLVFEVPSYFYDRLYPFFAFLSEVKNKSSNDLVTLGGSALNLFDINTWTLFSGILSQQHMPPLMRPYPIIQTVCKIFLVVFSLSILNFYYSFTLTLAQRRKSEKVSRLLFFNASTIILSFIFLFFSRATFYSQAKSFQYILLLVFSSILFSPIYIYKLLDKVFLKKTSILICVIWIICFFPIKVVTTLSLSYQFDRAQILSSEVEKFKNEILEKDKNAIFLMEPIKSPDTYFASQIFYHEKIFHLKDLKINKLFAEQYNRKKFKVASTSATLFDWIDPVKDFNHLWMLKPKIKKVQNIPILGESVVRKWSYEKLSEIKVPYSIFTADYYEKMPDKANYMRNGVIYWVINENENENDYFKLKLTFKTDAQHKQKIKNFYLTINSLNILEDSDDTLTLIAVFKKNINQRIYQIFNVPYVDAFIKIDSI